MKKQNIAYTTVFLILISAMVVLGYLYLQQRQITEDIETQLTEEKDSLESQLGKLRVEYDELVTENDSINKMLLEEQVKIESLISELKVTKATNYRKIKQYQKELGTLREIMRSYIVQIDSLNRRNQLLIAENQKVKSEYQKVQNEKVELEKQNLDLSSKVEMGSRIIAENIVAMAINKRSKETDRVKRAEKIKTCLTLKRNAIANPGNKMVFLKLEGPDGFVLAKSASDLFEIDGEMQLY